MAAFVDNLRDRWEGISPRERKLVLLLGGAAVLIVFLYLATSIRDGLSALETRNARTRRALAALADIRVRGEVAKPNDPAALITTEAIKLESYLTRVAGKVNVTIPSYTPRPSVPKNGYVTHAGQVDLRDLTITQVKGLLEAIETDSKVVMVTSLTLSRNFRDKEKLDLKMEIATYSKAEPAGGASGTGGAAPAPATPAAGKGS